MITRQQYGGTTWIDVVDPTEPDLDALDAEYGLGDRTFDEAHRRAARPTMQRLDDHAYVVAFSGKLAEIDMYVGDGWFVSVRRHDEEGREWDPSVAIARVERLGAKRLRHVGKYPRVMEKTAAPSGGADFGEVLFPEF